MCLCCGNSGHFLRDCRFRKNKCNCKQLGHLKRMCPKMQAGGKRDSARHNYEVSNPENPSTETSEVEFASLYQLLKPTARPQAISVGGVHLDMQIDSGASISAISERTYTNLFANYRLTPTTVCLKSYTNGVIHPCGTIKVQAKDSKSHSE
ncbi:hypothetical protein PR048_033088 [Dryococelus australis]|uniref:CCHC-type domain-containing protein n=1 Tax=Dryococelus australis TaxID=614101 RepID=A0ABQ9FZ95_9NEOP|nr:hypothetical protein PR048_033088 [Dryococelus australis]